MELNKKTLIPIILALVTGVVVGALFLGGGTSESTTDEHSHELAANGEWTCSMHPQVRQAEAGSCPFCGMDLIPVSNEESGDPRVLKMSNAAIQLANIQTSPVKRANGTNALYLNGKIKADERRVNTQTTHFAGRIERLYKNYKGQVVRKGEPVAALHSPELIAAQEELIEAKKLAKTNPVLLEAARRKLIYWKLTPEQIRQIEAAKSAVHEFEILADYDGTITDKMVNQGDHLHEGGSLLEITDLSRLWVVFEVYEKDLNKVKLGDRINFDVAGISRPFEATISFIEPEVNPRTRIVEVRANVSNAQRLLKPDMFVKAQLESDAGSALMVPKSAVLWTGKRSIVYVRLENKLEYELREITLGESIGSDYQVLDGLKEGEQVVTNGAFTLDAEAQLQGKISMMSPAVTVKNPETAVFTEVTLPAAVDMSSLVSPGFQQQLMNLSLEYLKLKDLMVEGNGTDIRKAGVLVKTLLTAMKQELQNAQANTHWAQMYGPMQESLELITNTGDRDAQRLQFINLSKSLINALQSFGTSLESPLYVQFCPMANNDKGATWISQEEEIINPYFGDVMLNCGNVEEVIVNK